MPVFFLAILPLLLFSNNNPSFPADIKIKGRVISAATRAPVANAYVYIIEGEEEALTNSKGGFEIISWQKLPFTLHIRHPKFKSKSIKVDKLTPLLIELDKN